MISFRYGGGSDAGLRRRVNEDAAYASPRLLAVADGMGGHAGGDVASSIAITALSALDSPGRGVTLASLRATVHEVNRRLRETAAQNPQLAGLGTTLTALVCDGAQIGVIHIGDSRAYLLRDGRLRQLTTDHTMVQALLDDGQITAHEAATHPHRSMLSKALDGTEAAQPDVAAYPPRPGDRVLLCSDGLSGVVEPALIHHVLASFDAPQPAVGELIELARRVGGPDNITCLIADIDTPTMSPGRSLAPGPQAVRLGAACSTPYT